MTCHLTSSAQTKHITEKIELLKNQELSLTWFDIKTAQTEFLKRVTTNSADTGS